MMKQHHEQAFARPERTTPRKAYEAALADFRPGATWAGLEAKQGKPTFVFWGKAAGMSADEIIADVHAAGVRNRDADIRRAWKTAHPQGDRPQASWTRTLTTKPNPPPTFPHYVRDMVASGGNEATSADLLALSPFAVPKDARAQTVAFLRSMFDPADNLYIFRDDVPSTGKIGTNLMPCCDWLATIEGGDATPGDLVVPNPFTGAEGKTADGKKSYIAQSCLARLPFVVIEFDSMPLKVQAAFWRGLLIRSPLAPKVAAITYSGSKSLHGLLHVGCDALSDWQIVCRQLRGLLSADSDPAFRADEQAMRPRTGTRLPGVRRFNNGKHQSLLYLNPEAVSSRMENPKAPTTPSAPRKTPQARSSHGAGKEPTSADERATGEFSALPCDCAPLPPAMPPDDAPLDELLAAFEVAEAWQSRFLPGPFK